LKIWDKTKGKYSDVRERQEALVGRRADEASSQIYPYGHLIATRHREIHKKIYHSRMIYNSEFSALSNIADSDCKLYHRVDGGRGVGGKIGRMTKVGQTHV